MLPRQTASPACVVPIPHLEHHCLVPYDPPRGPLLSPFPSVAGAVRDAPAFSTARMHVSRSLWPYSASLPPPAPTSACAHRAHRGLLPLAPAYTPTSSRRLYSLAPAPPAASFCTAADAEVAAAHLAWPSAPLHLTSSPCCSPTVRSCAPAHTGPCPPPLAHRPARAGLAHAGLATCQVRRPPPRPWACAHSGCAQRPHPRCLFGRRPQYRTHYGLGPMTCGAPPQNVF
nr:homeobox protein Hox-A4-like [Aegilops tauschii subsp. strangulata]